MDQLPVIHIKSQLKSVLQSKPFCIISAPPGSGKSTLVPQFILDDQICGEKNVLILQPRRIAARMLAGFVTKQRKGTLGEEVGYKVRLEGRASEKTRILFVTEGILMNRLFQKDLLKDIGVFVFDEFHERHLETDLCLALALRLQKTSRPDLKIVVMSATLDIETLKAFMGDDVPVIKSEGRAYPVEIKYKPGLPHEPMWESAANQLALAMNEINQGSALVFMPGSYEIRKTIEALQKKSSLASFEILALHGSLSKEAQDKAMEESGRKIIVSTNVAETSLTIPGVRLVVDSGLARVARFDARRGINTLFVENISTSSADQRAGRAGRVAPGTCIRLWSEFENANRVARLMPEIHRLDLSEVILNLVSIGFTNLADFPWLEKPNSGNIEKAISLLQNLGAIDHSGKITNMGTEMSKIGVHPRFARLLIEARKMDCITPASLLVAISQSSGILNRPNDPVVLQEQEYLFGNSSSDLLFELNAWIWAKSNQYEYAKCSSVGINVQTCRQIEVLANQILKQCGISKNEAFTETMISHEVGLRLRRCIFTGFVDFISIRPHAKSPVCQMMNGVSAKIDPKSMVQNARLMVASQLEEKKINNSTNLFF